MHIKAGLVAAFAGLGLIGGLPAAGMLPPPLPEPVAQEGNAKVTWREITHDFGTILDDGDQTFAFEFTNSGSTDLEIRDVKTTCGCTVPEMEKTTYAPGESGTLKVVFSPRGKKGPQNRAISVVTNDISQPTHIVRVLANVKPLVLMTPPLVQFGTLEKGETKTMEFQVAGRMEGFESTRATVGSGNVYSIEKVGTELREVEGEMLPTTTYKITLKDTAGVGRFPDSISIRTNDERRPIMSLQVMSFVRGDISVNPVRLSLGRVQGGQTFDREIRVGSRSGKPFKITGVEAVKDRLPEIGVDDMSITFDPVNPANPTLYKVRITGTASTVQKRMAGRLFISTDVTDEPPLEVLFYGQIPGN